MIERAEWVRSVTLAWYGGWVTALIAGAACGWLDLGPIVALILLGVVLSFLFRWVVMLFDGEA